jgi:2-polyprenyl-3-methyl-5-hydroxy-6-metoxy-1,4-benzoquinol methylase
MVVSVEAARRPDAEQGPDPVEIRRRVLDLSTSAYAFSALTAAFELGILDELAVPQTPGEVGRRTAAAEPVVHALLEVLLALGLVRRVETDRGPAFVCWPSVGAVASGRAKEFLLGDLRSTHYQAADLVERARRGDIAEEWRHTDPQLLDAQGVRSADAVAPLSARLFPMLEGLSESRERHGAAFLDVGTGVGWLAVEMCRRFPNLRAVGIDPYETALAHARRNIASVGLEGRIELRAQPVEELADARRFDIAWVPAMFLGHDRAARGLERIFHGLKPGAWALVASMADEGEELQPAVLRLIAVQYGGGGLFPEHVAGMLSAARFADDFVMPPMPGVAIRLTMGRGPPD